jgi:hypothetical protein
LGSGCHAPQLSDRGLEQLDRIVLPKLLDQDGDSFPQDSINFSLIGHDGSVFRSTRVFLDLHSISTSLAFLCDRASASRYNELRHQACTRESTR